jgi:hypothetical protein
MIPSMMICAVAMVGPAIISPVRGRPGRGGR